MPRFHTDPPEVPYPSEQDMDRAFLLDEVPPVLQFPIHHPRECPWFYPAMMAEVAQEEM